MQIAENAVETIRKSVVGCEELGQMGLIEVFRCCEKCHSTDEYSRGGSLGSCHATLPDGKAALVCCSGKKQLLERSGP